MTIIECEGLSAEKSVINLLNPSSNLEWPSVNFSLQHHNWIKHISQENERNDHKLKELLIVKHNSPCQHLGKCIENSMENIHTDVGV